MALQAQAAHAILVQYEDFLRDEAATVDRIAQVLNIARSPVFVSVESGVKRSDQRTTRAEYVDYYLNERWRDALTPETIGMINERLDLRLMTAFGYEVIAPPA
jgi:hypothetical protein